MQENIGNFLFSGLGFMVGSSVAGLFKDDDVGWRWGVRVSVHTCFFPFFINMKIGFLLAGDSVLRHYLFVPFDFRIERAETRRSGPSDSFAEFDVAG